MCIYCIWIDVASSLPVLDPVKILASEYWDNPETPNKATPSGSLVSGPLPTSYFEAAWILPLCHYVLHMCTMSPHGHLLLCALRMLQDPTDLQFWTGEFLNVPCGDGLHFHSSFPMCSVLNMWIPSLAFAVI